jgi:hypothetical protein
MVKHGLRGNTNNIEMYPRGLHPESGPLFLGSAEVNAGKHAGAAGCPTWKGSATLLTAPFVPSPR